MTKTGREVFPNDTYWHLAYAIKDGQIKAGELLDSADEISRTRGASYDEVQAALSKLTEIGYIEPVYRVVPRGKVTPAILKEADRMFCECAGKDPGNRTSSQPGSADAG